MPCRRAARRATRQSMMGWVGSDKRRRRVGAECARRVRRWEAERRMLRDGRNVQGQGSSGSVRGEQRRCVSVVGSRLEGVKSSFSPLLSTTRACTGH
eukprot:6181963-Pleurochrysis_carterae.AAC.1